jgi:hypothetical protein
VKIGETLQTAAVRGFGVGIRRFALLAPLLWCSGLGFAKTAAVIGDSFSTGAFAHPDLVLDRATLREQFSGAPKPSLRNQTQRMAPTLREFNQSVFWVFENVLFHFSSLYLDALDQAWSSRLLDNAALEITDVRTAAYDGAHLGSINRQVDRVLEKEGEFPDYFFIYFNLGDFCFWLNHEVPSADEYYEHLAEGVRYIARIKPQDKDVKIFLINPIGVLQLFESKKIAAKVVSIKTKPLTCGEVYKGVDPEPLLLGSPDPRIELVSEWMTNFPRNFCPRFFDEAARSVVANTILEYRTKTEELVRNFVQVPIAGVHVRQVSETSKIQWEPEDVANDCLHPSAFGHAKIADIVSRHVLE